MNSSKALIGMIAGLAAGAALGLLFAPAKGEETRERIGESLADLSENVKDKVSEQYEHVKDYAGKMADSVKSTFGGVEDTYDDEVDFV